MEIWKDIEGYEGLYKISNIGRVKSLKYGKEKILKSHKDKDGYVYVSLCKEGKIKTHKVHRLVASAFMDNSDNLPQVNHKDEDKTNNCVDNLEWCTGQYNINYGTRNKRASASCRKTILQFTKQSELVRKWDSATQVERELGIKHGDISKCCKGKLKLVGGYKWHYHYKNLWEKKHIPLIKQKRRVA